MAQVLCAIVNRTGTEVMTVPSFPSSRDDAGYINHCVAEMPSL